MDRLGKFLFVCALVIGGGYVACGIVFPTIYLRCKLTVKISFHASELGRIFRADVYFAGATLE